MTIGDINTFTTLRTGADTTAYTAANRLISTNRWLHKIWTMIFAADDDWQIDDINTTGTYPTATRAMIANQRDYAFSTALWQFIGKEGASSASAAAINPLKIRRVDLTYDGTTSYKAEPFDANETGLGLGNDTNTDGRYDKSAPFYDIRDNSIWIYPMASTADVSAGAKIRITISREPAEFTSGEVSTGTKEPGFDEAFHSMIALGMSYDWFSSKNSPAFAGKAQQCWQELQDYEIRLKQWYGKKDEDRNYVLKPAFIDYE